MKRAFALSALFAFASLQAVAEVDEPDHPLYTADTTKFLLEKSTLVVVASVYSVSEGFSAGPIYEPNVAKLQPHQFVTFIDIERVLYGSAPDTERLRVDVFRIGAQNGESGIILKEKQRYIFFLRPWSSKDTTQTDGKPSVLRTSDVWFGVYPFDTSFANEIAQFSKPK